MGGRARIMSGFRVGPADPSGRHSSGRTAAALGPQRRLTPEYLQWTLIQAFAQSLGNNTKFFFGEKVPHPPSLGVPGLMDDPTADNPASGNGPHFPRKTRHFSCTSFRMCFSQKANVDNRFAWQQTIQETQQSSVMIVGGIQTSEETAQFTKRVFIFSIKTSFQKKWILRKKKPAV